MFDIMRFVAASALLASAGGCSIVKTLQFSHDERVSGFTKGEIVKVWYAKPASGRSGCPDANNCSTFADSGIPQQVLRRCSGLPAGSQTLGAVSLPFIVAGGQIAFDMALGAIDDRRETLKRAAVKDYDATAITNDLTLGDDGSGAVECVIIQRFVGDESSELAMTAVSYLKTYVSAGSNGRADVKGLTWAPAYLRVDLAAAQTGKASERKPKVHLTKALSTAAIQPDAKGADDTVELVSSSLFEFKGIEIGSTYVSPAFIGEISSWPSDWKKLTAPDGPLFAPLTSAPTVGAISVAIVERGSAASLGDVSATEKAVRASIRGAIGQSLNAQFSK